LPTDELVKEYIKVGGVRIEDDVVVTKDGYYNLTTAPSDIEEIEKLTASDS
jgi:Xaa-Pro dipeptidase